MSNFDLHADRILILDFGSQWTQLIARRVREIGVYCEIRSPDITENALREFAPRGVILSGGPESVVGEATPKTPRAVFELKVPVLGICYGMQDMAAQLGGKVSSEAHREFGVEFLTVTAPSRLLDGIEDQRDAQNRPQLEVMMNHGDTVTALPRGFVRIGVSQGQACAAMGDDPRRFYAVQFHPEVTQTRQGLAILKRFVLELCGCKPLWNSASIIENAMRTVRENVGSDKVLLALSGGVDSSVVAALLHRAIGDQLACVFVDTGLLRLNEGDQVMDTFARHMGVRVIRVDAEQRYLAALKGVVDPEHKRKIIGGLFIEIFEEQAAKLKDVRWLAQGTIYPDVIESAAASGKAQVIKSHHNVAGLPERMHLKLVEPLRELFKDEVRMIGLELGLPREMVYRHPFPGPGLGVRILGEVKKEYADLLRRADSIYIEELRSAGLYDQVSQAFAVFLPVRSVGVMGDGRRYDYVVALRAVETVDFMSARWARLPYVFLERVSRRIVNEVPGISRVVYDVTGKPPATIEWE
ncbi:MAG: glutamine-hydrolyzing GMP synthase [Gammaproteobacteria bacterium]|nr:glutamine-hydrolyzing GMP synthase [Gammaproteobacteria bacterium]MBU6508946.1 glutamine-hydrolyzing GMP synthase [Gammaproteobacteria bacterium]MDE1983623.1 glutamine-hydrolyzing GMP synthase [Gammaproteobacteria bacterium]MDE2459894.1 glutamine-hydrolyzing GMP synthase [Gammaproteobacteria bacterium]